MKDFKLSVLSNQMLNVILEFDNISSQLFDVMNEMYGEKEAEKASYEFIEKADVARKFLFENLNDFMSQNLSSTDSNKI